MENIITTQLLAAIHDEGVAPCIIHEYDDNTMYVGYCLPDCTSFTENKWIVKRILKQQLTGGTGTTQSIQYLAGSKKFDQAWNGHETKTNYYYVNSSF